MSSQSTTIELNGKIYDAHSGKLVKTIVKNKPTPPPRQSVGTIDGFQRATLHNATKTSIKAPLPTATKKKSHTKAHSAERVHARTQRSKTLNRFSVKKPIKKLSSISSQLKTSAIKKPESARREILSKQVKKSSFISKFSPAQPRQTTVIKKSSSPSVKTSSRVDNLSAKEKIIKQGMDKIELPKSHHLRKKSRKFGKLGWGASVIAFLAIVGYVFYLNVPNLKMKVAASKAGFSANLPSYNPSGYKMNGPISYSAGQITVGYRSNTDTRHFSITQKKSNWDSESLLSNFVNEKKNYQTIRDQGLTVYVYDDSSATWVNGGIWYMIEGESELSSQQIIKIATSM